MTTTNLLLQPVDFKIEQTTLGTWKRHLTIGGSSYAEFMSTARMAGMPLVHITLGRNPETGHRKVAMGCIAIGRIAVGVVPIGQVAIGVCPIGQLSLGLLVGVGQLTTGIFAIGQMALGVLLGIGQFATGFYAIGQFGFGYYVLAQIGAGVHVWSTAVKDAVARRAFRFFLGR